MPLTVKTNRHWRETVFRDDVPAKVLEKEFDYQSVPREEGGFFCYRGHWYHTDQFMQVDKKSPLAGWDYYLSDSYFSGIVIKFDNDYDYLQIGTYFS